MVQARVLNEAIAAREIGDVSAGSHCGTFPLIPRIFLADAWGMQNHSNTQAAKIGRTPGQNSSATTRPPAASTLLVHVLNAYIARRTDMKPWSIKMLKQARDKLLRFFGPERDITSITVADAKDFKRAVSVDVSIAYTAKIVILSRQFFADAVDRDLLTRSVFAKVKAGSQRNPARQRFIPRDIIDRAIEAAPTTEWKLIIAFARYGGVRIPSEIHRLAWNDIDFDRGRILIHSPKTEHHAGRGERVIPLFPELATLLRLARDTKDRDAAWVFPTVRMRSGNLRSGFIRILDSAGIEPWPRIFQNLRSSRQTELADSFPMHVACQWIGNSVDVARDHYLQVTAEHFCRAVLPPVVGVNQGVNRSENT